MHASQKVDVRDILDCDYKVISQIVNMLLDPISSKTGAAKQVSPCKPLPFDILSLNLYMSWVVSKLLELQCHWKVQNRTRRGLTKKLYTIYPSTKNYLCIITLLNAWGLVTGTAVLPERNVSQVRLRCSCLFLYSVRIVSDLIFRIRSDGEKT